MLSYFADCNQVWKALSNIQAYLKSLSLGKIETDIPAGAYIQDHKLISIGKGTVIEPGAYIRGPCIIGENCTIRHGAYIRGDFIAGNNCVIGHDTEIKNSVFLNGVCAGHFAYLGDSILGNNVNLGAGTKCANLKLDNGQISILIEGKQVATGLRKLGAIIGDNCQTGCNSVLNPGTLFGKNVFCYPCVNVGGFVEQDSIVKSEKNVKIVPNKRSKNK